MRDRAPRPAILAVAAVAAAAGAGFQQRPTERVETCVNSACHASIVDHKVMHGPTAQGKCAACHAWDDPLAHTFKLAEPAESLCTACHVFQDRTWVHEPVRQGGCTGCHDPHGSDHPYMLVADPVRGLCQTCHQQAETSKFVHGPVAAGACILCHDPHSSWQPALLTEAPRELCLGCHAEMAPDPARDRYRHEPFDGDCLACHDAHGSDFHSQLHADAPGLCFTCHEDLQARLKTAAVVHGALVLPGACLTCHDAHRSPLPALQRDAPIALCLACHNEPMSATDGRELPDMAALLRDNPDHHGPIREGACTACHDPHLGQYERLLSEAYPPEFYAPFEPARYALCFECHLPEMVASEHGTGVTRFRDGDRNLHWLHVNREKGRTCRACHEVHASRNPFHIRDSVPFGTRGWELEIGFHQTDTGGSCAPGCHAIQAYDRGTPAREAPAPMGGGAP